jgi:hypothetical protein
LPLFDRVVNSAALKETDSVGTVTSRKTSFESPPPGAGFETVITLVPTLATLEAGTVAVNLLVFTNVVARAVPFQFTTAPGTNPVPFTVRENPGPPGATDEGTSG